ncbi:MAG: hypothetical protein WD555_06035 [Fulvivirga sp.]
MTDINTGHPENLPYIELREGKRKISFRRDCFGKIEILRKVNDGDWKLLIRKVRTPYVDEERFPAGTKLSYEIKLEENEETKQFNFNVRL